MPPPRDRDRRPILVTGAHRSGTTWVGQMLDASGETAYVHEPFNLIVRPGWVAPPFPHWYLYVTRDNEATYRDAVEAAFGLRYPVRGQVETSPRIFAVSAARTAMAAVDRARRRRVLVKDPLALFSTEWLVETFAAVPVVMIRHPAAFASSLQRLAWRFDFSDWLDQPLLLRDHLHRYEREMRALAASDHDYVDEAALMWRAIYATVGEFQRRHPEWHFVRHEDLAADAVAGFEDLYRRVGLTWSTRAESAIQRSSTGTDAEPTPGAVAPSRRDSAAISRLWARRLGGDDVKRLKDAVADTSPLFYGDDEW